MTTITMKEYLEQSGRTASKLDVVRKDLYPTDAKLAFDLTNLMVNGQTADLMKRGLFYKEPNAKLQERADAFKIKAEEMYTATGQHIEADRKFTDEQIDIIHAALGLISEAGEIIEEVVMSFIDKRPTDHTNLREESGDVLWYEALLLRTIKSKFEDEAGRNLSKLAKRYPEKFTSEAALNRDLDAEKKVLSAK